MGLAPSPCCDIIWGCPGACCNDVTPLTPFIWDRMTGLPNSACPSGLPAGQGPLGWGRFLDAVLQELMSELVDAGVPFGCELLVATVVVEEVEDVDDTEEDELLRWIVFRGMNMPLTSSGFIEFRLCPPLTFHAGRLSC